MKKKWIFLLVSLFVLVSGYFYISTRKEKSIEPQGSHPGHFVPKESQTVSQRGVVPSKNPQRSISSTKRLKHIQEDFKELKSFSDSQGRYFISKSYGAVTADDFDNSWPYLLKLQQYYIVEKNNSYIPVAYEKNSGRMGILTGSIMVEVKSKKYFTRIQNQLRGEKTLQLSRAFAHINVLHIDVQEKQKILEIVEKLSANDDLLRIEVEFFSDILHPM